MEFTEAELRREAREQELKQAMQEFEARKRQFNEAKSRGAMPEEELQQLASQVDVALNAAWEITQNRRGRRDDP